MNSKIFFDIICVLVFAVQLAVCFLVKRRWLCWLPVLLLAGLAGACFTFYWCSGFTNWAWLIIFALISMVLLAAIGAWAIYGLYCLAKKVFRF